MDEQQRNEREETEAERQAAEAREHWKKAKEELKAAFKSVREERRRARGEGQTDELDETLDDIAETARRFAREVSEEARNVASDVWKGARPHIHGRWREQWEKTVGKDWQEHWLFGGRRFRHWGVGGEETNPFVAAILSRGGGLLAVYVLHLLAEQPRHGNDVMRQIENRTMGSWGSNPGAIYPLLSSMEENGLVQSRWEDPDKRTRRIYQITDEGRNELDRLSKVLRPKVMEAIEVLHVIYDDVYGREEGGSPSGGETQGQARPMGPATGGQTPGAQPPEQEFDATVDEGTANQPTGNQGWGKRWRFGRIFGQGDAPAMA